MSFTRGGTPGICLARIGCHWRLMKNHKGWGSQRSLQADGVLSQAEVGYITPAISSRQRGAGIRLHLRNIW